MLYSYLLLVYMINENMTTISLRSTFLLIYVINNNRTTTSERLNPQNFCHNMLDASGACSVKDFGLVLGFFPLSNIKATIMRIKASEASKPKQDYNISVANSSTPNDSQFMVLIVTKKMC